MRKVAFLALGESSYPLHPIRTSETTWVVAYSVSSGVDHAFAAGAMRHLIGDFTDTTVPADEARQLLSLALRRTVRLRTRARLLRHAATAGLAALRSPALPPRA